MKYYRFAIIDMCDECRMTLMRNDKIASQFVVKDVGQGSGTHCVVCNRPNAFTMSVLTDYYPKTDLLPLSERSEENLDKRLHELNAKERRSIDEGFELMLLKDRLSQI